MSVHSMQRKRRRDPAKVRYKSMGSHEEFLSRISKSLYYGQLPKTERFSLPVTELAAELFSEVKSGRSLDRLHLEDAADMSRNACVSPASLVLAMLYLERLKISAPEFVDRVSSSQLFLVSSLVASKFLQDDGEEDEVFNSEWATSADIPLQQLNRLEKDFLAAIKWEVYVETGDFWKRLEWLEEEIAMRQGSKRGWFSYSDLTALLHSVDSLTLANALLSVGAVCLTAYAAGVVSMVGSTALVSTLCRPGFYMPTTYYHPNEHTNATHSSTPSPQDKLGDSGERNKDCRLSDGIDGSPACHLIETQSAGCVRDSWNRSVRAPSTIRCSTNNSDGGGTITEDMRWLTDSIVQSYSISRYLLDPVTRPLYSYVASR